MAIGDYPIEYNRKVHGTYDPSRYYGKPDTKFGDVKLGELGSWIARREKTPTAVARACSRFYWNWQQRWVQPRRHSPAFFFQFVVSCSALFYIMNIDKMIHHRNYKYH